MKPIKDCLNPRLLALCQKSAQLHSVEEQCLQFLKPGLREHCQVRQFNEGRLVLAVSDPVWATELRYQVPELRDHLRSEAGLHQLSSIEVKIGFASQPEKTKKKRQIAPLGPAAKKALTSLAHDCDFQPLKEALNKLANLQIKRNEQDMF